MSTSRKLTAILAADVVGYARLMGVDEAGTHSALKAHREELIEPEIGQHHGRVVKTTGDGLLAEFASVVDAVECAVDVQMGMAGRNAGVAEERRIEFRVGINLGDVIVDGDDIYGDGVNVAARLEGLAETGGVCVSGSVYEQVKNKLDFDFEFLGKQQVKNIAEPVPVFRVLLAPKDLGGGAEAAGPALPEKPSIAVLPFDNMSGDPEQEYFVDGIAEDIITALSKIRWFFVIARNSTFAYKGTSPDVRQVGRELGVHYVLEGSVRKGGNRVRISAQLIEAATGKHVWAERYDRDLDDIFALQDEMTETIVAAIEPELGSAERERAKRKPPENLDAWDCCQRGLWHLWKFTKDDNAEAKKLFQRAIKLDLNFATPCAGLAFAHLADIFLGYTESRAESVAEAFSAARKAVSLDDKDPVAHWAMGRVHSYRGKHDAAIAELERALDLNPSFAPAYFGLGFALTFSGRAEDAISQFEKALRLSPNDPLSWAFMLMRALALLLMKQYDEAADWAQKGARQPNAHIWAYVFLAAALGHLGRAEEAEAALNEALRMKPDFSLAFARQALPWTYPADLEHYLDGLVKAGLEE